MASIASPMAFISFFGRNAKNLACVLVRGFVCSVTMSILCAPRMSDVSSSTVSSDLSLRFLFFTRRLRVAAFHRFYSGLNVALLVESTRAYFDSVFRPAWEVELCNLRPLVAKKQLSFNQLSIFFFRPFSLKPTINSSQL